MKKIKKILGLSIVAGAVMWGNVSLAQMGRFLFPSASFFTPTASFYQSADEPSVTEVLSTMKDHQAFSSQLESTGVGDGVRGNYLTILAPTDKAFANLPADVKAKLNNPENLEKLLKYHFVAGKITEKDIQRQAVATQLDQTSISIVGIPVGNDVGVKLNDATATEPTHAIDGVIIPIDKVLIPPSF